MPTQDILQFFRQEEPRFNDISDADLINFIGGTQKEFLQDAEFKGVYQDTLRSRINVEEDPGPSTPEIAVKSGLRGIVDVAASVPKAVAFGATAINKLRGDDTPPEELTTFQLGELIKEMGAEAFPLDDKARDTWTAKISQGLGSAAGFMAGGGAASAVGRGFAGIAGLGSAATADEFYTDAKQSGADEDTAFKAAALGAGVGLTELVPLNRILNRATGGAASGFKKALLDAALEGGEEAVQELTQNTLQNVTAQQLGYDPDRGVWEGGLESATVGGTTGVILSGIASALGARRVRLPDEVQEAEAEAEAATVSDTVEPIAEVPTATEAVDEGISNVEDVEARPIGSLPVDPASTPVTEAQEQLDLSTTPEAKEKAARVVALDAEIEKTLETLTGVEADAEVRNALLDEGSPDSLKAFAESAGIEVERVQQEVKRLQKLRDEAIEAQLDFREEAQAALDPVPQITEDLDVETDVAPETRSLITLGAVDPKMAASFRMGEKGKIEFTGTRMARLGLGVRSTLRGGKIKDIATEVQNRAKAKLTDLKRQGETLASALEAGLAKVYKGVPAEQRNVAPVNRILRNHSLLGTTRLEGFAKELFAHKGDGYVISKADLDVARDILEVIVKARRLVDYLARKEVDLGMVDESIADTFRGNHGFYLTRSYKTFSPAFGWKWDTIPQSIKDDAIAFIQKDQKVDETAAMNAAKEMIDDGNRTFDTMVGSGSSKGIPARLLRARKDIPEPIRALLGEINDPVTNIYTTVAKQADLIIGFQTQNTVADILLKTGLATEGKDYSKGFTEQVFDTNFATKIGSKKKYPSLRPLFTTPELATELEEFYRVFKPGKLLQVLAKSARGLSGVSKYSQVILSPKAYSTQFIAAIANEMVNGRVGWDLGLLGGVVTAKRMGVSLAGVNVAASKTIVNNKKLRKSGQNLPTLEERDAFLKMKGSDFIKNFKSIMKDRSVLMEDLATEFGALGDQIDMKLLEDTIISRREIDYLKSVDAKRIWEESGKRMSPDQLKRLSSTALKNAIKTLPAYYSGMDRIGKFNAFLVETLDAAYSKPDALLQEVMEQSAEITQATTPSPSSVPKVLKDASIFGLLNTYVSWYLELIRNRYNQTHIALTHMKSKDSRVRTSGSRRMASLLGTVAMVGAVRPLFEQMFQWSGDNDEEFDDRKSQVIIKHLMPPWDEDQAIGISKFDDNGFRYSNLSYMLQDTALAAPIFAAVRGDSLEDAYDRAISSAMDQFVGNSPVAEAFASIIANYDFNTGRPITNPELPKANQRKDKAVYFYENALQSGIDRLVRQKAPKIFEGSTARSGREYSVQEEILSLVGIRSYGYKWEGAVRGRMGWYDQRYRNAKRILGGIKEETLRASGRSEEAERRIALEEDALKRIENSYAKFYTDILSLEKLTPQDLNKLAKNLYASEAKGGSGVVSEGLQRAANDAVADSR